MGHLDWHDMVDPVVAGNRSSFDLCLKNPAAEHFHSNTKLVSRLSNN